MEIFHIYLNSEQKCVREVDKVAAKFWNVPIQENHFASPFNPEYRHTTIKVRKGHIMYSGTWHEIIRQAVTLLPSGNVRWVTIKKEMKRIADDELTHMQDCLYWGPFLKFIQHLEVRGYKIKRL